MTTAKTMRADSDRPTARATPPKSEAAAAATPPVPADIERRVRLTDGERAPVGFLPHRRRQPAPEVGPFDLAASMEKLKRCQHWDHPEWKAFAVFAVMPAGLSKQEAWFWLSLLDVTGRSSRYGYLSAEDVHAAAAAELPGDADVRAWAHDVPNRDEHVYLAPQALLPFFTPLELAGLLLDKAAAVPTRWHREPRGDRAVRRFCELIVPQLRGGERTAFLEAMRRRYDAKAGISTPGAHFVACLLSAAGGDPRVAAHAASQPDKSWRHRDGAFELLAGVGDEATFVHEARRLIGLLRSPRELVLWLAATEWRELDMVRDAVLAATSKAEAADMTRILARVEAPETALPMLELQLKSKMPAVAAKWLAAHPLHAAVGLVPAAMGQGRLADAARDHLVTMRRWGLAPVLGAAAAHLAPAEAAFLQREILDTVEETAPAPAPVEWPGALRAAFANVKAPRMAKPPVWLPIHALPPVKVGGGRLGAAEVAAVLAALKASSGHGAAAALVAALRDHADPVALDDFAWRLFELWYGIGAPSADRWAMAAIGRIGGDSCVFRLTPLVRGWPGEKQHGRAVFGLRCLREIGSDTALMALDGIARRRKFRGLKQKAQEMMAEIAQSRGLTRDELDDRVVPDCGLDARGSRVFDFGPRQFRFVLGADLKPLLRDGAGKVRSGLPAPTRTDDPALVEAAAAEWKLLKQTLREVLKVQARRLEDAMISGRRWTPAEFDTLLVRHPLMVNLVRQLVFAAYDGSGRVTRTFRITEDQTLADENDEATALPCEGTVGVVHPAHLGDALRSAWGQVLGDYAIIPPFAQLGRAVSRPDAEDLDATEITRFRGRWIPGFVMRGILTGSRWLPVPGSGAGRHARHYPSAGLTAFITGSSDDYGHIEDIHFVSGAPGEHDHRLRIRDVDPAVLSEVLRLAHAIASKAG